MLSSNNRFAAIAGGSALALTMFASTTLAATTFSLFGDATELSPGEFKLVSDADPGFGGVDIDNSAITQFNQINELSADFNVTDDDCSAGSPRFQINVNTESGTKNVFVYLDPTPAASGGCPQNTYISSGNLIGDNNPGRWDTSQLQAGTQVSTYAATAALFAANPSWTITGFQLVVDSGFSSGGEQTIHVKNIKLNGNVVVGPPKDKDACKNGGWRNFNNPSFKNQGQCVSYTNHN
jgi:hypothetical protein